MAETYPRFGLTVLRQELIEDEVGQLAAAIPHNLETFSPDFDDGNGSNGYVLWQRKYQPEVPSHLQAALSFITSVELDPGKLRAYQVNVQQPGGEQAFHTDKPFSRSLTINLDPGGLFEFRDHRNRIRAITVSSGDIIIQSMANKLLHRGRNPSAATRRTMALFFLTDRVQAAHTLDI